jgi:hypothetical protein
VTFLFHDRYTVVLVVDVVERTVLGMNRSRERIEVMTSQLEACLVSGDAKAVQSLGKRLRRRLRAAEVRDRLVLAKGRISRLDMLDRRAGRFLFGVQLAELLEHLGDGWDRVRFDDLLCSYRQSVELPVSMSLS